MPEVDNEKDIPRNMVVSMQEQQQRLPKINRKIQALEDKIKQANISISQVGEINKEAEVYSKVGRLFIKAQKNQVVEDLDNQLTSSGKQLICLRKNKILLRHQMKDIENSCRELMSREPVESLSRAVVMFTHSHPHLSGKKVWVAFNSFTEPRLQDGPQCGIVALVVAAKLMGVEGMTVDMVMELVIKREFSKRGEMFSVDSMATIAEEIMPSCYVKVEQTTKLLDTMWLVDMLMKGGVMIVPYDCGPDNRPVLAKGHKAHWAVITGFLSPSSSIPDQSSPLPACPGFHLLSSAVPCQLEEDYVMLVARQSKSMELGIWGRDKLVESCMNLQEAAQKRLDGSYILPDGGLRSGLCGRMLVVKAPP